jgi:carbonic anhydrase/acetyltransferase-like protein (isoleucine patch superfamily)
MPIILAYRGVVPRIDDDAFVASGATVIGDVEIGYEASIWFGCVLRGDEHSIKIGARSNLQDGTIVHISGRKQGTYIGADVSVGHSALLHACTLDDRSYVGMGAQILDEAVVESGGMLAAGALLTQGKRVKSGELWAGRPAKLLRPISEEECVIFGRTAQNYVERSRVYRDEQKSQSSRGRHHVG